ncbi:VOC family protein [Catalinimonas sp. 4WD22]|jgi:catechol 2,3-dioxygenase-like lactoylglutathione lyase family enzyme|uniref:VOC family protein n=1 Tax=Catalinimonas locisalis TaxID=3133978 RepID=UPI003101A31C
MEILQIKENCLYVSDLLRTRHFYKEVIGLELISFVEGRHVFFRAGRSVLLCFLPEVTKQEETLPPHFAYGQQHLAFEVSQSEYEEWKKKLTDQNIKIVHEQHWKENLYSFYFYDPDQHVLEIIPPGIWE